jgi:isopropylmalate/homocitrate/citramalate synthase
MPALTQYASPYNWLHDAVKESRKPQTAIIHDLTLEGDAEEMAGVKFTHRERLEIAKGLARAGVQRISVLGNSPRPTRGEVASAEAIASLGLSSKVGALVKTEEEIDVCRRIGLWGVTILVGVNDKVLTGGRTGTDIIDRCKALTNKAKEHGLHTCLMAMDATRTSPEFLEKVVRTLDPYLDEYTIADSLGVISPLGMQYLAGLVRQWTAKPLQVHPHNHTSAATSVAVGAILGGVSIVHTTVNGVGEFTGLCPLEEFAVAAEMHAGVSTGIDLTHLKELSKRVARATGISIPLNKPVVGEAAFAIPETEEIQQVYYELHREQKFAAGFMYPPELVGATSRMSIGRKCHVYTVLYNLEVLGYAIDFATAQTIAGLVRNHLRNRKGYTLMTEDEFLSFVRKNGFVLKRERAHKPSSN